LRLSLFWFVMQHEWILVYWCFRTIYQSLFQGSGILFWLLVPYRWDRIGCPETSVDNYHHTLYNISCHLLFFKCYILHQMASRDWWLCTMLCFTHQLKFLKLHGHSYEVYVILNMSHAIWKFHTVTVCVVNIKKLCFTQYVGM